MAEATAQEMSVPKHGEFCWSEIGTTDLEQCMTFYKNVFGWEIKESKAAGAEMQYHEFNLPGEYAMGGIYKMTPEMFGGHMPPPHFMNYVSVTNVDETASKVEDLGGKIVSPPMDIPNVGRFCVIQDPTGAHVALLTLEGGM
jgi:predicted enzyme related to lactoylglutathione lyase